MCHLLLALPLIALPVFWLLPMSAALPLYGAVLALTAIVYTLVLKALRRPVGTGREALLHASGQVRQVNGRRAMVWVRSELWSADADGEDLVVGDAVNVTGIDGLRLRIRRAQASEAPAAGGETRIFH